jgi:hypothetical protein
MVLTRVRSIKKEESMERGFTPGMTDLHMRAILKTMLEMEMAYFIGIMAKVTKEIT